MLESIVELNALESRECFAIIEEGGVKDFASHNDHIQNFCIQQQLTVFILFSIDIII